jgi:glycosyltransferase involved in cell wall biosynthesis
VRIAFLVPGLSRSGGIDVITGHARRLQASGAADVELVAREPDPDQAERLPVPVRTLEEAAGRRYDVALGTWWETVHDLFSLDAGRHAVLLQSFEQRFYGSDARPEQIAAGLTYQLPLHFLGVSKWICRAFGELRPDARCALVLNGIDKAVFTPRPRVPGRALRVLIEGHPSLWFKGVEDAVTAVRQMKERADVTLVSLEPPERADLPVDRVLSALSAPEMAALYSETDVLVKMSRVEGLGLAPLEAFHCGVPCVVTPYTGHDDYVRHGENGLVCGFDDPVTAAAYLDRLATDRELLTRLSEGALATATAWPTLDQSTEALTTELRQIVAAPPPIQDRSTWARQLAYARLSFELSREERMNRQRAALAMQGSLEWHERAVSTLTDDLDDLRRRRASDIDALTGSRTYRFSLLLRRLVRRR